MMLEFALRRLFLVLFMLFTLSLFAFSLSYWFPGDPLTNLSGLSPNSMEQATLLSAKYHMEESYISQYFAFVGRLLEGDWGQSFASGKAIFTHVLELAPATFELAIYALIISVVIGLPCGILAALFKGQWVDRLLSGLTLIGYSIPIFWLALLLIMVFCLQLGLFPMSGRIGLLYEIPASTNFMLIDIALAGFPYGGQAFLDALHHLALPAIVLAVYPTTVLIRFTKDSMLHVLDQNYVKTARAKGLSRRQLVVRHALRNALLPVIKQIGLQFSALITFAMITEVIFSWPGIGRWLIDSIYQRDFPAIQGGLMAISIFIILATIATEVLYTLLDPISRNQSHGKV